MSLRPIGYEKYRFREEGNVLTKRFRRNTRKCDKEEESLCRITTRAFSRECRFDYGWNIFDLESGFSASLVRPSYRIFTDGALSFVYSSRLLWARLTESGKSPCEIVHERSEIVREKSRRLISFSDKRRERISLRVSHWSLRADDK